MDEIEAVADWLRQRDGETDAAWIARLRTLFALEEDGTDDPEADRIGDRLWRRLQARRKANRDDM